VVADAARSVAEFFEGCNVKKSALIAPTYVYPKVLELPWKYKIVYNIEDQDQSYVYAAHNIIGMIDREITAIPGGIIVGNTAFICSKIAGCNPITFIGNDLCMPEPSNVFGETSFKGKDNLGNTVYSLPGFLAGYEWLLKFIKVDKDIRYGKLKLYNSTEGGIMYSEGIEGIALEDFLKKHPGAAKSLDTMLRKKLGG